MTMTKLFWVSAASGVLLIGGAFGAAWYAARSPKSVLARVLEGADHAAATCKPTGGFGSLVGRVESAKAKASGETDLKADGLPDEPMALEGATTVVVPEAEPTPVTTNGFPAESVTPPAPPAAGAPATMPHCTDDVPRVPKAEEEQEGCAADLKLMFQDFLRKVMSEESSKLLSGMGTPECREDPNRLHHHGGCPYTGGGYPASPAREKARKLNERLNEVVPAMPGVDTMELRPGDWRRWLPDGDGL